MTRVLNYAVIGITVLLLTFGAIACNDGESEREMDSTAKPGGTPVNTRSDYPTPVIEGDRYYFNEKGYSIVPPEGWHVQANNALDKINNVFPRDAFFSDEEFADIQTSISASCQKPRGEFEDLISFRDRWQELIRLTANTSPAPYALTVAGWEAYAFDYSQPLLHRTEPGQAQSIDKTDVVVVANGCNWVFTLATPPGQRERYMPLFEETLSSVEFASLDS